MNTVGDRGRHVERVAVKVIDAILSGTDHNLVTLSGILGISLKKLVLKKGFTAEEASLIASIGSSLAIN